MKLGESVQKTESFFKEDWALLSKSGDNKADNEEGDGAEDDGSAGGEVIGIGEEEAKKDAQKGDSDGNSHGFFESFVPLCGRQNRNNHQRSNKKNANNAHRNCHHSGRKHCKHQTISSHVHSARLRDIFIK